MSVAQEFGADSRRIRRRNDGYIENDGYVITWCVGHLVEMVYPEEYDERYKKWRLEDLPFLPRDYKYNVIPSVSRQYDVVHKMLHREDIDTVLLGRRCWKKKDRRSRRRSGSSAACVRA